VPVMAGVTLTFKMRSEERVGLVYVGDGATSTGAFHEGINFAAVQGLPLVVIVENNRNAYSTPTSKQSAVAQFVDKAIGYGVYGEQVDGYDVLAVYDCTKRAVDRARAGEGVSLLEFMTYRLSDHTTADDARRYRPQDEVDANWAKEPLIRLRKYLESKKAWDDKKEAAWKDECAKRVDEEVKIYKAAGKPPVTDMFDHMFANMPEDLLAQRAEAEQEAKVARDLWHMGLADEALLRDLLASHARHTGSVQARRILDTWTACRAKFVKVFPNEYRRALGELAAKNRKIAA